jgi:hypothetical protein
MRVKEPKIEAMIGNAARRAIPWLFGAAGAMSLLTGLGWLGYAAYLSLHGRRADGVVVGHDEQAPAAETGTGRIGSVYAPVVSFHTAEGRTVEFTSIEYVAMSEYPLGLHVPVVYDPGSPERAEIDSFETLWLMGLLFCGGSLACVGAGFGAAWTLRKMREPAVSSG